MKEKDLDKDTIVAYHAYLQTRIHNELNGVGLGPGWLPCRLALLCLAFSLASFVTGVLVISLRHLHVYLVDWWHAFIGPFFVVLSLILLSIASYLIITAKRRSNQYRRELFFRPIGDYGVAVVHKSTLLHEQEHRSDLKTGTTPHRKVMPSSEAFSSRSRDRKKGHENRGYSHNGQEDRRDGRGRRHDDDRRRHDDDRRRHDDDRRRHDDRHRDRDRDDRRRHDDRERRRPPDDRRDDHRRPPRDDRDRGDYEKRRPPPENRDRGEHEKRRPPPGDDERGSQEKRPPPEDGEQRTSSQGGRRAARGAPKLQVTDTSKDSKLVLDADFGKPADDESEL